MRVPSNLITENQYTIGKEFMYLMTYKEYQGYYYIINDRYFTGKTYAESGSLELIKINPENNNLLLTQASTYVYGLLSKTKINNSKVPGVVSSDIYDIDPEITNFYCKKLNTNPILIRQISEQTYSNIKNDPLYVVTYIGKYNGVENDTTDAFTQIPELRSWFYPD